LQQNPEHYIFDPKCCSEEEMFGTISIIIMMETPSKLFSNLGERVHKYLNKYKVLEWMMVLVIMHILLLLVVLVILVSYRAKRHANRCLVYQIKKFEELFRDWEVQRQGAIPKSNSFWEEGVLTCPRDNSKMQSHYYAGDSGIHIDKVYLQGSNVPDEVIPAWNEVNVARQEKEKLVNQAWEEYNRVIPKAKGQAEQQIRNAEGYALERINQSQGDAERFTLTLAEYKKAPEVTKKRLYLEMMGKVLPNVKDKWFLDDSQKGILPFLNLTADAARSES